MKKNNRRKTESNEYNYYTAINGKKKDANVQLIKKAIDEVKKKNENIKLVNQKEESDGRNR